MEEKEDYKEDIMPRNRKKKIQKKRKKRLGQGRRKSGDKK